MGRPSFCEQSLHFIFQSSFYTLSYAQRIMGEGVESCSKPGFLPANLCKSLGDLHHLLAQRPVNILRLFLQKTYFSLKVISQAPPGNPLQYSCLENPMDGGSWQATVHGVAKSRTQLSDFTFTFMVCAKLLQLCLTLCDPMNCIPPVSSVHGILQTKKKKKNRNGLPCPSSGDLPNPRIKPVSSLLASELFTTSAIWEAPVGPNFIIIYLVEYQWMMLDRHGV